jgi:hypothetical protein
VFCLENSVLFHHWKWSQRDPAAVVPDIVAHKFMSIIVIVSPLYVPVLILIVIVQIGLLLYLCHESISTQ